MYITEVLTKTKTGKITHRCILLRESYREDGKVKNRTIANLTHCQPQDIAALRLALQHKGALTDLTALQDALELRQGPSMGAAWLVYQVAPRLGIEKALGTMRAGMLALWHVMARVIAQGSRLSAVRLAQVHAACDILGLQKASTKSTCIKTWPGYQAGKNPLSNSCYTLGAKVASPPCFYTMSPAVMSKASTMPWPTGAIIATRNPARNKWWWGCCAMNKAILSPSKSSSARRVILIRWRAKSPKQ